MGNLIKIKNLRLKNYRNHLDIKIEPKKNIIIIYGKNGSGKTNILESISLLDSANGLRNANLSEIVSDELNGPIELFGSSFELESESLIKKIGLGLKKKNENFVKEIRIDNSKTERSALKKDLSIFWVVPKMSYLFQNSSEDRRSFIDMMINSVDKNHLENVSKYQKLKKERMKILKTPNFEKQSAWLDTIEKKMCFFGMIVCDSRRTFLKSLNEKLNVINDKTSNFFLEFNGSIDTLLKSKPAIYVEEFFLKNLKENRYKDSVSGRTNFSANKTDLLVYEAISKKEAKNFSTGEQKLIVISIIFSFIEYTKKVKKIGLIFLLDDIFSYLDKNYIIQLITKLDELRIQTWITDVRADSIRKNSNLCKIIHKINIGDKGFKVQDI